ncbi:HNH endonuclease family protein [Pseudomonas aeruginosa]
MSYAIEHILPQNEVLSSAWQAELGPDWQQTQQKYLHTLGNLTLTG